MTMYERLLINGCKVLPELRRFSDYAAVARDSKRICKMLEDANPTVINVDNVAKYFYEGTDQEVWDLCVDFPNVAPPWPAMFIEYRAPSHILSRETGVTPFKKSAMGSTFAVLLQSAKTPEALGRAPELVNLLPARILAEAEWVSQALTFVEFSKGDISVLGSTFWFVRKDGTVIDPGEGKWLHTFFGAMTLPPPLLEKIGPELKAWLWVFIYVAALSLCFIHCRNTTVVEHPPDANTMRRMRKKHGREPVIYRTLEIEPVKKILREAGSSELHGLKFALHICRGHFKDYRERGLFGRNKGIYWWDMHCRGTAEEGVVVKDYKTVGNPRR